MPLKSILEIDVQDDSFREFQARFDDYQGRLKELPNTAGEAAAVFDKLVAHQREITANGKLQALARGRALELDRRDDAAKAKADHDALGRLQKLNKATSDWAARVAAGALGWKQISANAKLTYNHVDSTTKALSKWVLLKGLFGVTGLGGSLYGLDRLAGMAAGARRQSMGTGTPYGAQRAFALDYGRFTDGDAMLGAIGRAQSDVNSPGYTALLSSGISASEIRDRNTADLGVEFFDKMAAKLPKDTKSPLFGTLFDAYNFGSIVPFEGAKRFVNTGQDEKLKQRSDYENDKRSMAVDPASLRKWADLDQALSRAKGSIETALVTGLAPLAPEIGDLSKGVSKLIGDFAKSPEVKADLDDIVKGLDSFDKALSDPNSWWNKAGNALNSFSKAEKDAGDATNSWLTQHAPYVTWNYWRDRIFGGAPASDMVRGRAPSIRYGRQHAGAPYVGDGGAVPTGAHDALKDLIAQHETGTTGAAGYDTVYSHAERGGPLAPPKPVSQMTIAEVLAYQREMKPRAGSEAFPVGRAQWTESTLRGLTRGMDPNTVFSPALQERLFDRSIAGRMGQGPGGFRSEWASLGGVSDADIGAAMQARRDAVQRLSAMAASAASGQYPDWMDGRSRRELAAVNAPLARDLLAAAKETGLHFQVAQGLRSQAEANANAMSGRGVRNSQHLYGAAADIHLVDANGNVTYDRALYKRFADAYTAHSRAAGGQGRWLGDLGGRWGSDIVHFDQGLGYGQSHARDPYGTGGPTKDDIAANNRAIYASPMNPFLRGGRPDATVMGDGTVVLHRSRGMAFHREIQALHRRVAADALKSDADAAHQHFANMKTVLRAHEGRLEPWQHSFRAAVEAARSRRDIDRVQGEPPRSGPQRTSGLNLDQYHRSPMPHVTISNATGANVAQSAGPASY